MPKFETAKKIAAGLFFVLSIALIVTVVFVIGLEKGFTQPKMKMTVVFNKIGGLNVGAPVRMLGVTVGSVKDIGFREDPFEGREVEVSLELFKRHEEQFREITEVAIITEGVLGEKIIEIATSPEVYREDLRQPIIGKDPLDVQDLTQTFSDAAEAFLQSSNAVERITTQMEEISISTARLLNRIEQRIIDGTLFKVF